MRNGVNLQMSNEETRVKVIIIGDKCVGKTSLLIRFVYGSFCKGYCETIGVECTNKTINVEGKNLRLQLWDTAGQERYKAVTRNYYSRSDAVIVVFDLTSKETLVQIESWIQSIKDTIADPFDVILIGNKSDGRRVISREEGSQMANRYGVPYYETSAKTGEGVDSAFVNLGSSVARRKLTRASNNSQKLNLTAPRPMKEEKCDC